MAETTPKTKFEIAVDLIKALLWPLIVIVLLIIFLGPLRSVADQLPNLVKNSETITISGLSIKIRKNDLVKNPSDSVKAVLSKLTPEEIERILNNSSSIFWDKGDEKWGVSEYSNMIKQGLFVEIPKTELPIKPGREYGYGIKPTNFGIETRKFLVQLIAGFISELK